MICIIIDALMLFSRNHVTRLHFASWAPVSPMLSLPCISSSSAFPTFSSNLSVHLCIIFILFNWFMFPVDVCHLYDFSGIQTYLSGTCAHSFILLESVTSWYLIKNNVSLLVPSGFYILQKRSTTKIRFNDDGCLTRWCSVRWLFDALQWQFWEWMIPRAAWGVWSFQT